MTYLWRIKVDRPVATNTFLFNPPDRMFYALNPTVGIFNNLGGSYMLDSPIDQRSTSAPYPGIRIRFDRPMHLKNVHVKLTQGRYYMYVYNENWTQVLHYVDPRYTSYSSSAPGDTDTITFPNDSLWAKNIEFHYDNAHHPTASLRLAFEVYNHMPGTLLVNSTHELNFSDPVFETVVSTMSKHLSLQMVSGKCPDTTVSATLLSS